MQVNRKILFFQWQEFYLYLFFFVVLFLISYHDTLKWMLDRYNSVDSYYSHGFIIPFVSGYLVWLKRHVLHEIACETKWFGFLLVVLAAALHILGTAVYIFSISGFSIWILIYGIVLFMWGWERTKVVCFPIFYLLFMFPAPLAFISTISFPLKMFVAQYGVKIIHLMGFPIYREGFNVFIPQGVLIIGNPCSGLRSLISFLALGSLMAYVSNLSGIRRWVLFFVSIPIALLSNLIRVPILILWAYKFGLASVAPDTFVHTGSGLVVFLLGLGLMYASMICLGIGHEK
ncbi:exosortase [Desulfocicer vacuolatum DSM 3385]|uniref:Exosortase n=1 Tax=Desulfocicer vacuolatum DSM 3385 TaxID=1121400 RepID=A0A1W1ZQM3_9BACT|nr:exosortase/archaeosortase family protein [Desulfocicer vacuolatum]SMC50371.1 exosortase [Desulfocicer vacuolatum DSM 3385]